MSNTTANRPRLDDIDHLPVGEIARLPAEYLALLDKYFS